jgi:sugar lactone lactonase YvrE
VSVTVSIGGVTASFTVTTVPDTVPDPFSFTDQIDVGLGAQVDSAPVVIAGIAAPSPISITGGQYAIDGGAFGSSPSLIQNGQSVVVRVTAAVTLITTVDVTLTIGGVSDTFSATTFADVTAPTAVITYPPLTSRTGADSIRIRGTAADDYSTTAAVRVNGVLATTSDGFATWFANVSLTPELNVFAIETEDSEGNLDSTAAQAVVRRRVRFGEIQGIALGPNPGTIFVVDSAARALATLDLTTDERTIVSDNGIPNADYGFLIPKTVVVDPVSVNDRAFVLDPSLAGILSVDLSTGERTIFSDPSTPDTANLIQSAADMALDAANSRLLVVDSSRPAIIAVDLTTGVRAILSDATTPDGTNLFSAPREIAVDAANNRALVTNAFPYAVFAVDLASGTRTILSNDSIPDGVNPLTFPQDIAVDAANARALVAQPETDSILAIDLATGSRSILSSNTFPDSIDPIGDAIALEVDPANSRLLVMEQGTRRRIFGVDLGSGSRTILSSDEPELAANPFSEPTGIMLDPDNGRALVTDRENASVVAVNLATAERSIFSGIGTPDSSNPFSSPGEIVSDFAADRAYELDEYRGGVDDAEIIAMNLSTGLRTVVTDEAYPDTVNTLTTPLNMTLDLSRNRILVSDVARTAVLAVDITTGERTVFSSNTIPDGVNPYTEPRGIVIDEAANRGLIVNSTSSFSSQILAVDVDTGARTLFSDITEPDGQNPFTGPTFVLLDVSNDRLFLVDRQQSQLMTVELASGARDLLSSNYAPFPANPFGGPTGIAYDEANEILYVVNQWFDGVLAVDTTTGHRVYVLQ